MLFGASERNVIVSNNYYMSIKKHLENYKKEVGACKKDIKSDKNDSDPFTFPLHMMLAT